MEDEIEFSRDVNEVGDVVVDESETVTAEIALDVVERAGDEIVHAHHFEAFVQQTPTQV